MKVAEVVADVDIARAEELVWPMGTPARDMALAKIAMVAARTDSTRAGEIAFTVTGRPRPTPGQGGRKREAAPPPSMLNDPNRAIYWKVRALTEIAVLVARADFDLFGTAAGRRRAVRPYPRRSGHLAGHGAGRVRRPAPAATTLVPGRATADGG